MARSKSGQNKWGVGHKGKLLLACLSTMPVDAERMPVPWERLGIRLATLADIPRIRQCNLDNLPENYPDTFFQRHIYTWPDLSIIAEDIDNDVLVGYALGRTEMVANKKGARDVVERPRYMGHVTSIAVDRDYRGYGLASSLMVRLHEEMIRHYEVNRVNLHVRVSNEAAISLYNKKLAYECTERVSEYYADREDAWVMECDRGDMVVSEEAVLTPPSSSSFSSSPSSLSSQ